MFWCFHNQARTVIKKALWFSIYPRMSVSEVHMRSARAVWSDSGCCCLTGSLWARGVDAFPTQMGFIISASADFATQLPKFRSKPVKRGKIQYLYLHPIALDLIGKCLVSTTNSAARWQVIQSICNEYQTANNQNTECCHWQILIYWLSSASHQGEYRDANICPMYRCSSYLSV